MARGIIIIGVAGSGKTTLGKLLAEKLNYKYIDIDEYIWHQDTVIPFSKMYSKEEKIINLNNAIKDIDNFVMAGSMYSIHQHFDELFDLTIFLTCDKETRITRLQKREKERFGNRIEVGGDMYEGHINFINYVSNYETGKDGSNLAQHKKWLSELKCPIITLDGAKPLDDNLNKIVEVYEKIKLIHK